MASVTTTIPDALVPRVVAALQWQYPQHKDLTGIPLAKACIKTWLQGTVALYEAQQVHVNADATAAAAAQVARVDMDAIS
jgi:hypothetical protein